MLSFISNRYFSQKIVIVLLTCFFFNLDKSIYALPEEAVDVDLSLPSRENRTELMAKYFLNSFVEKKDTPLVVDAKKEMNRKTYDISTPDLSPRDRASIMLLKVFSTQNRAKEDFLDEIDPYAVDMRVGLWSTMNILVGSVSAPDKTIVNSCLRQGASQLEAVSMAFFLTTPIADIQKLKQRQERIAVLINNTSFKKFLEGQFEEIAQLESSLLSLYDKDKDPLFSASYQKGLQRLFPHKEGKFVNMWYIEFSKRSSLDLNCSFMLFFLSIPFFVSSYKIFLNIKLLSDNKKFKIYVLSSLVYPFIYVFVLSIPPRTVLEMYTMYKNYISGRIADARKFLIIAHAINEKIGSDPKLEALYGDKLKYTRQLLAQKHINPNCNKLVKMLVENDFSKWSLFFNSMGKLLVTLTLLEENIHMFDEVFFELGQISVFLSFARLIENRDENKNKFNFGRYYTDKEKPEAYIDFKNSWSISIDQNEAVSNDLSVDGKIHNIAAVMGPNGCGKSVIFIRSMFENILLMQTAGIMAGEGALTPFWAIFVFREPKDDPSIKRSLYMRVLEAIVVSNGIEIKCKKVGKKMITLMDEFLNETNYSESAALQIITIKDKMDNFPKNLYIISTHNLYLIKMLSQSAKGKVYRVEIKRNPDGSYEPLYKISPGLTEEKVGIDLYEKITGEKDLAKKARILRNEIESAQAA